MRDIISIMILLNHFPQLIKDTWSEIPLTFHLGDRTPQSGPTYPDSCCAIVQNNIQCE